MHIAILAYGSHGDVQPYLALGLGLQRAGHSVRLAAPGAFETFVRQYGLDFAPLAGEPAALSRELVDRAGHSPIRAAAAMAGYTFPLALRVLAQAREACQDADAIIHSFLMVTAGHEISRERGIPDFFAQPFPVFASTSAFPALMAPPLPLGGGYNRLTHDLSTWLFWNASRMLYGWLRRQHADLPPLSGWPFNARDRRPPPILFGFSPLVIPRPADWAENVHVTGYWFVDEPPGWEPPAALAHFLEAGPPPIYAGFGSMITQDAEKLTRVVVDGLRRAGRRGLILGGWSGVGGSLSGQKNMLVIDAVPHSWLFPRMAAIIHHGGAGTTAAALRSGVPALVVPFTADQPFWGVRVHALGVGPRPIPRRRLTPERLAEAVDGMVNDRAMRDQAVALGKKIRSEDGVGRAVEIIEGYLAKR
jgi:sterol 3beta-glucosyltransferase